MVHTHGLSLRDRHGRVRAWLLCFSCLLPDSARMQYLLVLDLCSCVVGAACRGGTECCVCTCAASLFLALSHCDIPGYPGVAFLQVAGCLSQGLSRSKLPAVVRRPSRAQSLVLSPLTLEHWRACGFGRHAQLLWGLQLQNCAEVVRGHALTLSVSLWVVVSCGLRSSATCLFLYQQAAGLVYSQARCLQRLCSSAQLVHAGV